VAIAAIPSTANGNITSCILKTSGATRIIDYQTGKRCKATETTLNWSQAGPAGPAGPSGPAGPEGMAGPLAGLETADAIFVIGAGESFTRDIHCPSDPNLGKSVINGGYNIDPGGVITGSYSAQLKYLVNGTNPTDHAVNLRINVFCASVDF
jgi:hypothetical protein